jgi:hypothetical protein
MSRLADLVDVLRSKNAGPFQLTIDLFFPDDETYLRVVQSRVLEPTSVAALYGVAETQVKLFEFHRIKAMKVTLERPGPSSGAPGDNDVYGAQQHGPLLMLEVP